MNDQKVFHVIERTAHEYKPLEKHVAESQWQFCNCKTCQDKRHFLDSLPGPPFNYAKFRHKDEPY